MADISFKVLDQGSGDKQSTSVEITVDGSDRSSELEKLASKIPSVKAQLSSIRDHNRTLNITARLSRDEYSTLQNYIIEINRPPFFPSILRDFELEHLVRSDGVYRGLESRSELNRRYPMYKYGGFKF